jgi:hypothetical protein
MGAVVAPPAVTPVAVAAPVAEPTETMGAVVAPPAVTPVAEPAPVAEPTETMGAVVAPPAVTPVVVAAPIAAPAETTGAVLAPPVLVLDGAEVVAGVVEAGVPVLPPAIGTLVSPSGITSLMTVVTGLLTPSPPSADTSLGTCRPITPPRPIAMARTSPTRKF